jgi:uncharacterized protein YegL
MNYRKIQIRTVWGAVSLLCTIGASLCTIGASLALFSQTGASGQAAAGSPAGPAASSHLTAGATYSNSDGNGSPKFPDVDVIYTLTGSDGTPIVAKPGDLKLSAMGKELGTATAIRTFDKTGYGITAILALDASGSMRGAPINAIHSTIARFVNQARPFDKVAVVTFADDTRIDVPFGGSQTAITKELETVQPRGHYTRLYDGLLDAMAQFNANQPKRRQLVVISDGHDENSRKQIADVLVQAKHLGVVIDCIGLTKDHGEYLNSLQQLSAETGGTYRRANSAQELDSLIGQGIGATRATPVATFTTTNLAADNALHSTQFRWQPGNLSATAFIQTPQGTALSATLGKVKSYLPGSLSMWALGGCFVVGILLLVISWAGMKSKRKPMPIVPVPPVAPFPVPMPPVMTPPAQNAARPQRTPTLSESQRNAGPSSDLPAKPAVTTLEPPTPIFKGRPDEAGNTFKDSPHERSKTKLAAFFDAPKDGPYALIFMQGDVDGHAIPVTKTTFSLGALAGNDLSLPGDPTVSGRHAKLFWEGAILKIEDLQSTNGTFVNSERLAPGRQLLRPGDEVRLGQTVIILDRA